MKRLGLLGALALFWAAAVAGEPILSIDRQAARGLVEARAHAAPTILALWSTDCPHCKGNLKLFADMVAADARLRLITIAVEPLSDDLAAPLDRLGVPGKRFAYGTESPESLAHALDPKWRGELPRTIFFDGHGGRTVLSGVVDAATARRALGL